MKYVTSPIIGVLYNFLLNFIRIYDVAYHVKTGITIVQVKSQVQPNNKLQSTVMRNPPCRLHTASRPVYVSNILGKKPGS